MQTCTVCRSSHRERVELELLRGSPERSIAAQSGLSRAALRRHAASHLPAALRLARALEDERRAAGLGVELRQVVAAALADRAAALMLFERAMQPGGDGRVALRAIEVANHCLRPIARAIEVQARACAPDSEPEPLTIRIIPRVRYEGDTSWMVHAEPDAEPPALPGPGANGGR